MSGWYTIVTSGGLFRPTPARGPWRSIEDAEAAMQRFAERHGADAGEHLCATSARIVGPFRTRRIAREVDISNYTRFLGR